MPYRPTYRGFLALCKALGYPLAPHQRKIAAAMFGPEREVGASLPRGCAKSTTAALIALHHILSVKDASAYIGAGSLEQARIIGGILARFARHKALTGLLTIRHNEIRLGDRRGPTVLRIVSSDGERAFGWERPTLLIGDECWTWSDRDPTLLGAMTTSLVKNPACRLLLISTAPMTADSPLGRVRERALSAPEVRRQGFYLDCRGLGLRWLEYSVPDDAEPTPENAKKATPAPWISVDMLREQRQRTSDAEWLPMHCNRSHVQAARWLPPAAWQECKADYQVGDDEPLILGVDIGGSRSNSALVGVVADSDGVRVALVEIRAGKAAVLDVVASIRALVEQGRPIACVAHDPMRFSASALELERDYGLLTVEFPQSLIRMVRASENLSRLIIDKRLRHFGHPTLTAHVSNAVAKQTDRGFRLVRAGEGAHRNVDGVIALALACDVAEKVPERARVLGWSD